MKSELEKVKDEYVKSLKIGLSTWEQYCEYMEYRFTIEDIDNIAIRHAKKLKLK